MTTLNRQRCVFMVKAERRASHSATLCAAWLSRIGLDKVGPPTIEVSSAVAPLPRD